MLVMLPSGPKQICAGSMTAVAEDVVELDIKVQDMTCNGCTSREQDTLCYVQSKLQNKALARTKSRDRDPSLLRTTSR